MKKHENILVFAKGQLTYHPQMRLGKPYMQKRKPVNDNGSNYGTIIRANTVNAGLRYPTSIIAFDREVGLHPTQKPVALWEYLILTYTNPGDVVLDNCCGSGTTGVACKRSGRHSIRIENNPEYYDIAVRRLSETPEVQG
jgi:DNA modification methylase